MNNKIIAPMAIAAIAGYVGFQMLSDLGALKLFSFFGLAMTGGTLTYPFTFTLRDMIHKSFGKKITQTVILSAAGINIIMALLFSLWIALPPAEGWPLQAQFAAILGPVWRIVIASILAELLSELADTEAYHYFVSKITKKHQWLRVLFSNSISTPIDSMVFVFVAFYGVLPMFVLWQMVLTQTLMKMALGVVSMPAIYLVKERK